jgi:PAS domain S-box-containing protein
MNLAYILLITSISIIIIESFVIIRKTIKIKDEKEYYYSIIESILCVINIEGKILNSNHIWNELTSNNDSIQPYKCFFDYFTPASRIDIIEKIKMIDSKRVDYLDSQMAFSNNLIHTISWSITKDFKRQLIYLSGKDLTNERFVYDQLQQSEEKSRKQFKSIPIPTYTWKRITDDFVLTDFNDIVYNETEGKIRHLLGVSVYKVLSKNFEIINDMDKCYITRKTIKKEVKYFVEDTDEIKYYNISYAFVPPNAVMVHMEDKTQKKLMELQVKENEEKYRTLFNTTTDAIVLVNIDGEIVECNKASEQMFEYNIDDLLNSDIQNIIKMKYNEVNSSLISKVEGFIFELFNKSIIDGFVEILCVKKSGEVFPAEVQTQFIKIKDDNILLLYIRDISQRKKMEKALMDSEAQLRTAFDNLPFDFWITDRELNISMQSDYSIKLWSNFISKNLSDLAVPKHIYDIWYDACRMALDGHTHSTEISVIVNDEIKTFLQMVVPVISENNISGVLSVNIDITEAKLKEQELKRYSDSLEKANQELKTFAYIISHDLKAPLRAINNLIDWITEDYIDLFDNEGKNMLSLLSNRVNCMHDLIESILRYSRIGRVEVTIEDTDLNHLLSTTINLLHIPKSVKVLTPEDLPIVKLPRLYVQQIFQNLLSNALKFLDKDEGLIEIGYTEKDDFYEFFVRDNGPGIDKQYYDKIFQIFQTLQPRDEYESTGIGLSIVKKILNNYNGDIWLDSEIDKGTTFYFKLPKEY